MPRRYHDSSEEPPKKKSSSGLASTIDLKSGEIVTDINLKKWKLGKSIGIGGFGEIYQASDDLVRDVKTDTSYVAKVERHTNGPLFVEINCYLRIAKLDMIEDWKNDHQLKFLGMPHYVASGSHHYKSEKYRFLILPKYQTDLGQILKEKKVFNFKTVLTISIQILDVLEYIHSKGYVHSDIKASNIMVGKSQPKLSLEKIVDKYIAPKYQMRPVTKRPARSRRRNLRPATCVQYVDDIPYLEEVLDMHENQNINKYVDKNSYESEHVYLLDYGLASKYVLANGAHREFCRDERRAHAGTTLFCSRDAHKGVPSRRSDLESLAYNMVYWLTGTLPWIDDLEEPEEVEKKKNRCFRNLSSFLELCFNHDYPQFLQEYFNYLNKLQFEENPDYVYCRRILRGAIRSYGYKVDSVLDFDNLEGCGKKKSKQKKPVARENRKVIQTSFLKSSPLMPLDSNIVFKRPKLRKKVKNKKVTDSMMNWSKILKDPEDIIKQARERKATDGSDSGASNLSLSELVEMNPTYAMMEVYNKMSERELSPTYVADSGNIDNIDGYTAAMMSVYTKMKERQELEYQMELCKNNNNYIIVKDTQTTAKKLGRKRPARRNDTTQITERTKSSTIVSRKKDGVPAKKSKLVPLRRTYSLRG